MSAAAPRSTLFRVGFSSTSTTLESATIPRLSPTELSEARCASGNLGGRPRKPTQAEARDAALAELVPPAIRSLKAHLADGDPAAWRAALRVLEHAIGRPAETLDEPEPPVDPMGFARMTQRQRSALLAEVLEAHPNLAALVPPNYERMIDSSS